MFASAPGYHVVANSAFGKLRKSCCVPALPSTALVASHGRALNWDDTWIVTFDDRMLPQMFAAAWKTNNRWAPRVMPGLPPTGWTGVASLKPSFTPSELTMMIV